MNRRNIMKPVRTRFSKTAKVENTLKRKAFLDALYDEGMEDPYAYPTITDAISDLAKRHKLSFEEIVYLKKKSNKEKIGFVEKNRK